MSRKNKKSNEPIVEYKYENGLATPIIGDNGSRFKSIREMASALKADRGCIVKNLKNTGIYTKQGVKYRLMKPSEIETVKAPVYIQKEDEEEYQNFKKFKDVKNTPFEKYEFKYDKRRKHVSKYAIALFSDAHIEETVRPEAVLGKNEYNLEIAKKRIEKYFVNLVTCLNKDGVEDLVFACLGDIISNVIHDELMMENSLTPLQSTFYAQSLIYSGLCYIVENTKLNSIKFIGIVGNHGRTTKKIQHSNGFKMNYEFLIYKNVEQQCKMAGMNIEFIIPESELALLDMPDGHRFIFCHGFQIKGGCNSITGIYPSLSRFYHKEASVFGSHTLCIGHFHNCTQIKNAIVNGSIIGYNAFALSNGLPDEKPAQMYMVYSDNKEILTRKIYCE